MFRENLVSSMALKAEPTLSACTPYGLAGTHVVCELTFGEDYFYSQVLAETLTTRFGIFVEDGRVWASDLEIPAGETPNGVLAAEAEFRVWVERTRPELYDQVFFNESPVCSRRTPTGKKMP